LEDFSLRRVSRATALKRMLAPLPGADVSSILRAPLRGGRFAAQLLRDGMSRATATLFADYRRSLRPYDSSNYETWVRRVDTLTEERMTALRLRAAACVDDGPLISILLPVYQTPERWLRRCIDSVIGQAYPKWELCIADDASPDPRVAAVVREYADRDPRIRFVRREANGHISAASNSALALAQGEFVALLDHDDELRPHALLEMAEAIAADPGLELLYSDEDKLDAEG